MSLETNYKVCGEAFEQLVKPLLNKLYRYILYYIKDDDIAEDVLQNTLLKAYNNIELEVHVQQDQYWVTQYDKEQINIAYSDYLGY